MFRYFALFITIALYLYYFRFHYKKITTIFLSPSKISMNRDFVCNFDRQASYVVKREIYNDALEVSSHENICNIEEIESGSSQQNKVILSHGNVHIVLL